MEFDSIDTRPMQIFKRAKEIFSSKGYTFPQVICWNLDGKLKQLECMENVCLLSGYSGELLKVVLETKGPIDSNTLIEMVIEKYEPVYKKCERKSGFDINKLLNSSLFS